jgi:uncharacterized protein (UPF0548 family)
MISLGRPSQHTVEGFLSLQVDQGFSYSEVEMTRHTLTPPPGYIADHNRVKLGQGNLVFDQALKALKHWQHFNLGWVDVCSREVPIERGASVGLLTSFSAFWLLFSCRIVYVVNEEGLLQKYGFAYGTLPGHPECGEERFTVEWNHADDSVWYDILAFSHPANALTRVAYPVTRFLQKRFAKDSMGAMMKAVTGRC